MPVAEATSAKGTRSATRRKIALAQRERRLKLNTNHTISKQIVDTYPQAFIGLEDLTHIRTTKRRKHRRKASRCAVSAKARKQRHASHGLLRAAGVLLQGALSECVFK